MNRFASLICVAAFAGIASATPIVYQVSGTTTFGGKPGLLTISGSFDWGSASGLDSFAVTVAGYSSIVLTNTDGGTGSVNQPTLEFVDYTQDKSQQLTFLGTLGASLPTILGNSVPFSGTYSEQVIGTALDNVFTVQGSITAESLAAPILASVAPEPASLFLLSIPVVLLLLPRVRRLLTY